jgi:gliding motility-associated-like protein
MSHPLLLLYNSTRSKYLKLKARYDKTGGNGWHRQHPGRRKVHLIRQLRKLYNRLLDLQSRMKLGVGIATISLALSLSEKAEAQSLGPFEKQARPDNPLRNPIMRYDGDAMSAVDLDGDGDLDLAIGNTSFIRYFRNDGTPEEPVFEETSVDDNPFSELGLGAETYNYKPSFADLDEDGDMDMVLSTNKGLTYHRNDNGIFSLIPDDPWSHTPGVPGATGNPLHNLPTEQGGLNPHFADYDDDGDLDLILGHPAVYAPGMGGYSVVDIFVNNNNVSFAELPLEENPFISSAFRINNAVPRFIDIDNDGDLDMVVGHTGIEASPGALTFLNEGGEFAPDYNFNPFSFFGYYTSIEFADFDNDGDLEGLFAGSEPGDFDSQSFFYYVNNADLTFTQKAGLQNPLGGIPEVPPGFTTEIITPIFIDVDNDSDLDLFIGQTDTFNKYSTFGRIHFYRFDEGSQDYVKEDVDSDLAEGVPQMTVPVGVDWDNDGDTDIVTGGEEGVVKVYLNEGDGNWTSVASTLDALINTLFPVILAFYDVDFDGDKDAFAPFFDGTIHFYRNDGGDPRDPDFVEVNGAENLLDAFAGSPGFHGISVVDVDGDGWDDIIITSFNAPSIVYRFTPDNPDNPTTGAFTPMPDSENPFFGLSSLQYLSFTYIDIDGDGDRDVYSGAFSPDAENPGINLLLNNNPAPVIDAGVSEITFPSKVDFLITPSFSLIDTDNDLIMSATVSLNEYEPGKERLFISDPPAGIVTHFGDGVLYIKGPASVGTFEAALRAVTYRYDKDEGQRQNGRSFSRMININVLDADGTIATTNSTSIFMSHSNDVPVLNPTLHTVAYANNPLALHNAITITDNDDTNFLSAEVSFLSGFNAAEDVLSFANAFGITGSFDAGTGTLTLSGDRPIADYQAALRAIQYDNLLNASATPGLKEILVTAFDGEHHSNPAQINLVLSGDTPFLSSPVSSTPFTAPTVVINNNITIADADDVNLESASVNINAGFVASQDRLDFTNTANITGNYNATTGVLTLVGTATLAEYETALESVSYTNSNALPAKQTRVISFTVNDGTSTGNILSVGVVYPNTAPVVGPSAASVSFIGANLVINGSLTITDDDASLQAAVVSFTSGYVQGEDELLFANQNGITGTFNSTNGTLTLIGASSVANYQAALRSVQYRNVATNKTIGARAIRFTVNDGTVDGNFSVVTIAVGNNSPQLISSTAPKSYTTGDVVIDGGVVVSDPDNSMLASASVAISSGLQPGQDELLFSSQNGITGTFNATTGILTLGGAATVTNYQDALRSVQFRNSNAANRIGGPRVISFTVFDGGSNSNTTSVTIHVQSLAPVITSASNIFYISGELVINSGITVTDADNTTLQSAIVMISSGLQSGEDNLIFTDQNGITGNYNAAIGTLTLTGNSPVATYQTALRSVRYHNSSLQSNTTDRVITFAVYDGLNHASLGGNVIRLNKPPEIDITPQQTRAQGNVAFLTSTIFSDPDDNLDLSTITVESAHGANIIIEDGVITVDYSSFPDYEGVDQLTITICDAGGRCITRTIAIEVGAEPVIYTGMSPNGDGVNDFFFVRFAPPNTEVAILNRWGDIVFQTDKYNNDEPSNRFEGKNKNGTDLVDGAYFYKIRYVDGDKKIEKTGSLLLKR